MARDALLSPPAACGGVRGLIAVRSRERVVRLGLKITEELWELGIDLGGEFGVFFPTVSDCR